MSSKEQTHRNDKTSSKQGGPKPATEHSDIVAQQQTHPATIIQRARLDPSSLIASDVRYLQRTLGNNAVGRLLAQTAHHQPIQKEASTDLASALNRARSSGQPLEEGLQEPMGQSRGVDFSGVKVDTDARSDKLNQYNNATQMRGNDNGATRHSVATLQRWVSPAEDAAANRLRDNLDGIENSVNIQRNRARDLSTAVPLSLRAHWAVPRITAYQIADDLRVDVGTAIRLAQPATRTLANLRNDVQALGARLNQLRGVLDTFSAGYDRYANRIAEQAVRHTNLDQILLEPNGAAKLTQWQNLATAVQTMNLENIALGINAFNANIDSGTFTEDEVVAARLMVPCQQKNAIIQFLTELFASGQLQLSTWAKSYPTDWDLRTGEFGAEWHVKCGTQGWIGKKWVFHAHCETTRNDSGQHDGFRFKNILGTNHLKMISERMAAGVQLDLPLSAGTLNAMAAPYQDEFLDRLQNDATFRQVLKKSKRV